MRSLVRAVPTVAFLALGAAAAEEEAEDAAPKVRTISTGERVKLERHVAVGKYTVFEFFHSDWTPGGLDASAQIEMEVRRRDDMILRRIKVADWKAPVVRQHGITRLPHYKVFDPQGQLGKEFSPADASRPPARDANGANGAQRGGGRSPGARRASVPKIQTISSGQIVTIEDHLARGQHTLVEFYADW